MRVLKVRLKQSQAHYRKEESSRNKMTYPLPPISTVIGAIHNACGYTDYHPMNISIQGKYKSMYKRPYTDYCFLNSIMDDRGILVKFPNENIMSRAFTKVGTAKKSQGNSFRKGITIDVHDKELMDEYIALKDLGDEIARFKKERIDVFKNLVNRRKKALNTKKKKYDNKSEEFKILGKREKEIKALEKSTNDRFKEYTDKNYTNEIAKYGSLTTSIKYYEILADIELVLHIEADKDVMEDIRENIYNLKAIGRSEDNVELIGEASIIELNKKKIKLKNIYSSYIKREVIEEKMILLGSGNNESITSRGTRYLLNKNYKIVDGQRIFNKVNVLYTGNYKTSSKQENYIDDSEEKELIVSFI